jgi:cysteine synthase
MTRFHQATSGKGTGIMNELRRDILHCIGNTSLLALRNIPPKNGSRILLKLESENPTGSMKDRMALATIEGAEADGRLAADGSVVEYTAGSTGVSLSLICAVKGYPLHIVTSDGCGHGTSAGPGGRSLCGDLHGRQCHCRFAISQTTGT